MKLLILGGTTEAARLARTLAGSGIQFINSLAGRTDNAPPLPGATRVGGFGGPEGLAAYLKSEHIDRVIDATHPFAARISAHAAEACAAADVPRLMLVRPEWEQQPGDRWIMVDSMAKAARQAAGRAFLTVGIGEVAAFQHSDAWFLVRLIADQALPLKNYRVVTGKGPFDAEAEQALMREHAIGMVVTKASGGAATYGKIAAARALSLPVIMVRRPTLPEGERADSVEGALRWLAS